MAQDLKPIPARMIEARARAKKLGVRVIERVRGKHYECRSQSQAGVAYRLDRTAQGWTCECAGYDYTGACKHLAALQRRSERDGWDFGRIARLAVAFNDERAA